MDTQDHPTVPLLTPEPLRLPPVRGGHDRRLDPTGLIHIRPNHEHVPHVLVDPPSFTLTKGRDAEWEPEGRSWGVGIGPQGRTRSAPAPPGRTTTTRTVLPFCVRRRRLHVVTVLSAPLTSVPVRPPRDGTATRGSRPGRSPSLGVGGLSVGLLCSSPGAPGPVTDCEPSVPCTRTRSLPCPLRTSMGDRSPPGSWSLPCIVARGVSTVSL